MGICSISGHFFISRLSLPGLYPGVTERWIYTGDGGVAYTRCIFGFRMRAA